MAINSLGQSLRLARIKYKMSGLQVAEKLGLTAPAYRRYETDPTASTMMKLSTIYGCSIQALYLHGGEEPDGGINAPAISLNLKAGQTVNIVVSSNETEDEEKIAIRSG